MTCKYCENQTAAYCPDCTPLQPSYEIDINCAYCGHLNEDVYYAPACDCETFICKNCGEENYIIPSFSAVKKI